MKQSDEHNDEGQKNQHFFGITPSCLGREGEGGGGVDHLYVKAVSMCLYTH